MPSRTKNKSIPVPRDQSRSSRDNNAQQPAWRSSLDLVWSYSRSQAFYGNNIATSPSFVERRWAGQDLENGDGSDQEHLSSDDEENDYFASTGHSRSGTDADETTDTASVASDARFEPSDEFEWEGETLPPNAIGRSRRRRVSKVRDRRLEQLGESEGEGNGDQEERSRSRSRSPKQLSSRASNSRLNPNRINRQSQYSTHSAISAPADVLRDPFAEEDDQDAGKARSKVSESAPLLAKTKTNSYGALRRASGAGAVVPESSYQPLELGHSTLLQSWFNTVNALVGVGILALPLAFSYAGWIGGTVLFLVCGLLTNYTGKVLAKIMSKEPSLRTYADIGSYAFGPSARILISLFFCLELWAVSVALIILFGDSMAVIFPQVAPSAFKILGYCLVLPTVFLPLRFLSPISVIGIISTFTLVVVVISDGLIKPNSPGSIYHMAPTTLGPRWNRIPLSFGLIMSGFSSHPIIPSLVRDMKDPSKFPRMLNLAYVAATVLYLSMGMIGYAMFGVNVSDEITKDLAKTEGYPRWLNHLAIWLIVINPLSKFALATRPIQTTFEILLGIDDQTAARMEFRKRRRSSAARSITKAQCARDNGLVEEQDDGPTQNLISEATSTTLSVSSQNQGRVSFATTDSPNQPLTPRVPVLSPHHDEHPEPPADTGALANSAISLRAAQVTRKLSPRTRANLQTALKLTVTALIAVTAVVLPGFEQVMAFLGAFLAFATCVFGPLLANLKLFGAEMRWWRVSVDLLILGISAVMACTGTVWAFL
ncbi:related to amino acid transport protein [Melanopsichium pennsylvanicum]|uniref:Related to amino acid transport protein n=2 Tax=Melanopsichium pennsylvanicum TaxID=63383 RepID=A0AAJ4XR02_9BASI|nr:related to amino acid transport protein [Melanopsichium pennsylvanicum 4]SNX85493.1 related to amino acid transport protein [Melanopsichium pennsylvanicum]